MRLSMDFFMLIFSVQDAEEYHGAYPLKISGIVLPCSPDFVCEGRRTAPVNRSL